MFSQLSAGHSHKQRALVAASVLFHFLLLGWLSHGRKPIFVAPSSVMKGQPGGTLTRLYFGGTTGVTQEKLPVHITLPKAVKQNSRQLPPLPPRAKAGSAEVATLRSNEPLGGTPYGSLSYGSLTGTEVRPALPVFSPDPDIAPDITRSLSGDVIIEVTIDEAGHIEEIKLVQSVDPSVDQKVLATVQRWQFSPATRNGTPIPSKQDVYYHFPR